MKDLEKLKKEFEETRKELCSISYLKKGTLSKCYQTCGTASCRCHKDKRYRHGPYWWWSTKKGGRTKTILVPQEMLSEVRSYIDNYKLLKSKAKKLEDISEKIIKTRIKEHKMKKKQGG
jgi:hypothetical protein